LLLWAIVYDLEVEVADLISAFMQAPTRTAMYARPPVGLRSPGWYWKVLKAMNGARTASADFSEFLASVLTEKLGMIQGIVEPCMFKSSGLLRVCIHVDDPIATAKQGELVTFWTELEHYVLLRRAGMISFTEGVAYLGRMYQRFENDTKVGFTVKHSDKYLQSCGGVFGLTQQSAVKTAAAKDVAIKGAPVNLEPAGHSRYRAGVGKLQFLRSERSDLAHPLKCVAHRLGRPNTDDEQALKHLMRYLMGTMDYEQFLLVDKQMIPRIIAGYFFTDTFSDSDWAADLHERLSTTCAYSFVSDFLIEQTITAQDIVANSTAEAEYFAMGSGCKDSLYVRTLLTEFGFADQLPEGKHLSGRVFVDATNAMTNGSRRGPSKKTRHLDVRFHFVQQLVRRRQVLLRKVPGERNVADLGTKVHPAWKLRDLRLLLGLGRRSEVDEMGPLKDDERRLDKP